MVRTRKSMSVLESRAASDDAEAMEEIKMGTTPEVEIHEQWIQARAGDRAAIEWLKNKNLFRRFWSTFDNIADELEQEAVAALVHEASPFRARSERSATLAAETVVNHQAGIERHDDNGDAVAGRVTTSVNASPGSDEVIVGGIKQEANDEIAAAWYSAARQRGKRMAESSRAAQVAKDADADADERDGDEAEVELELKRVELQLKLHQMRKKRA